MTLVTRCGKRGLETCGPLRRERDEIIVVESDERRFENAGECQIVLRQQGRTSGRDQVHHRYMFGESEPVGAGNRDVHLFQGADHRLEEGAALAHENHHVAGANAPHPAAVLVMDTLERVGREPTRNGGGNPAGEYDRRLLFADKIERQPPIARIVTLFGDDRLPELDECRQISLPRRVHRLHIVGRKAAEILFDREDLVDHLENPRRRTKRHIQWDMREGLLSRFDARLKFPAHLIEHMRRCALKREDRLFLVTDGEECANPVVLAVARGEILGDTPQDFPLLRRGILRLVDENVIDARVELVEDPGRVGAGEQDERALDEIVEIKETAQRFRLRVVGENGSRERDERKTYARPSAPALCFSTRSHRRWRS